jgi:Chitobiase/beta-hexosaminidase C-terminal domain/F5/8 type C domain
MRPCFLEVVMRSCRLRRVVAIVSSCALLAAGHAARCGFNADTFGTESISSATSDGVLLLRHTLGLSGDALIARTAAANAASSAAATSDHIKEHFRFHRHQHDLDGDGIVDAIDAQIAMRYLLGFVGNTLTEGLSVRGRRDANAIAAYIAGGCSTAPPPLPDPIANVLYVSPSGTDSPSNGTQAAPLRTLAYACTRAQAGDAIRMSAGSFQETAQCVAKTGVRIMGNGREGANKTVVIAPLAWDFTADNTTDKPEGYSVLVSGVQNVTVDQIEFRGNANKANGAIRVLNSSNIMLRDLAIHDYRFTGLGVYSSSRVDAQNILIENSGYEWLPGVSTEFPSGGSVGNLGLSDVDDSVLAHFTIRTTAKHGYGVKAGNVTRTRFNHFAYDMFPYQSWNGGGPGNFDMELFGSHDRVEIAYNNFTQTVSLISFPPSNYASIDHTIHVHHNRFDQRVGAYGIETVGDKLIIDHNWFSGSWTAMQHYGDSNSLVRKFTAFNNVVDGLDSRLVGLKGRVEELRVFNNTAYLGPNGINQNYLVTVGSTANASRWMIGNNIVVGSPNKPTDARRLVVSYQTDEAPRDVLFTHNLHHQMSSAVQIAGNTVTLANPTQWDHRYVNDLAADPLLAQTGANAYQPTASSPAVDAGNANVGVKRAFAGSGRDIGAFEFGEAPWQRGVGAVSDIEYLAAPKTSVTDPFFVGSVNVDFTAQPGTQIRYTLDGSEPGWNSTLYTAPINVTSAVKLRARAFNEHFGSGAALMLNLAPDIRGYPNLALGRPDGAYTASSTYFETDPQGNLNYPPKRAFDDEYTSFLGWSPNQNAPLQWVQVDLGTQRRIRYLEFFTRWSVDQPETRRNFEVRASNDPTFATYTVLLAQGATTLPFQAVVEKEITDVNTYRYVRATKTVAEGFFVNELKIRGE